MLEYCRVHPRGRASVSRRTKRRRRAGERSSPDPGDSRAEGTVEVERGADQRQMGQRLGEVPLLLSGAADLLGIQAHVVGVVSIFSNASRASSRSPLLSLTAQAFLFTIALAKDANPGARVLTGILSVITSLMSIYLILSHRIHAERQGRVAMDLAPQLGAQRGPEQFHRGAAGVWAGVNRGSFALWIPASACSGW
jgi:hypothetical protein